MILEKNKKSKQSHGFTIVELLVVIVVIGILAAITIVSYAGITARANASKALANAQTVLSVAEAINADTDSKYPVTTGEFTSLASTSRIPSGIVISGTVDPTAATGTDHFRLYTSTTAGASKGGRVVFWDYSKANLCTSIAGNADGTTVDNCIYWGLAKAGNTFAAFAS